MLVVYVLVYLLQRNMKLANEILDGLRLRITTTESCERELGLGNGPQSRETVYRVLNQILR